MSNQFQYHHCYLNAASGQAFLVVAKDETVRWKKCIVIEGIAPGQKVGLFSMPLQFPADGWHEITRAEFEDLCRRYETNRVQDQAAAARVQSSFGVRARLVGFALKTLFTGGHRSPRPPKAPVKLEVLQGGKGKVCDDA